MHTKCWKRKWIITKTIPWKYQYTVHFCLNVQKFHWASVSNMRRKGHSFSDYVTLCHVIIQFSSKYFICPQGAIKGIIWWIWPTPIYRVTYTTFVQYTHKEQHQIKMVYFVKMFFVHPSYLTSSPRFLAAILLDSWWDSHHMSVLNLKSETLIGFQPSTQKPRTMTSTPPNWLQMSRESKGNMMSTFGLPLSPKPHLPSKWNT